MIRGGSFVSKYRPDERYECEKTPCLTKEADNLRYSFDSCVFAFPNGAGAGSNPCETSTACGALKTALEYGNLSTSGVNSDEFGYCDAGGGSMTGQYYQACLNCISASGDTNYTANGA